MVENPSNARWPDTHWRNCAQALAVTTARGASIAIISRNICCCMYLFPDFPDWIVPVSAPSKNASNIRSFSR